jgi:hypothetical protein
MWGAVGTIHTENGVTVTAPGTQIMLISFVAYFLVIKTMLELKRPFISCNRPQHNSHNKFIRGPYYDLMVS